MLTEPDLEKKPAAVRVALNPDGRSLAAGYTDGTIRLWSFPDRSVTVTLSGHRTEITALRYNKLLLALLHLLQLLFKHSYHFHINLAPVLKTN